MVEQNKPAKKKPAAKVEYKPVAATNECVKCDELEKRIAALEVSRLAFDKWCSAFGHYLLEIFEKQVRDEQA